MTGDAFGAEVEGWTLDYGVGADGGGDGGDGGTAFGREQYFPDGAVLWENGAGECLHGRWLPAGDLICFAYEDDPDDVRCWEVTREAGGVMARLPGAPEGDALREMRRSHENLTCPGPSLGV